MSNIIYYKVSIDICDMQCDSMADWSEVEVLATKQDDNSWYGKTDLVNLTPHTQYRVKVASRNDQGYNKFSKEHIFTTSKTGNSFTIKNLVLHSFCFQNH